MLDKTLAHYEILEKIGAGGMGEVFRARDTKLDREVAIKSLPPGFASDADHLARFEREARVLAGLNHPGIGAIYGIEEAGDSRYLVLELVPGEDLSQRLLRGPVPVGEAIPMALQIAEALEVAHEQGIVHRDLKPGNIKLTPEGKIKVLDFGLAKALERDSDSIAPLQDSPTMPVSTHTASGVILGTAAYMSPEQARGGRVDKRADVFAFGAVLMEMLTGQQTFPGSTVSDILAAVLRAEPPYKQLPSDTPWAIRRLLERCLEKDVRRRLRDIGEARIVLEDLRAGVGAEWSRPPGAAVSRPGPLRRNAGWAVALIAVLGAVGLLMTRSPERAPDRPLRKSAVALDHDDPSVHAGFRMALSPNGRFLVYTSQGQLWLRDLTTLKSRPIPGTEGGTPPFWSPDSRWIVFGLGSRIMKVPREGGAPTLLAAMPASTALGASSGGAWTIDDRILITTATEGIYQVSTHGGEVTEFMAPGEHDTDIHEVLALPGARGIVFVVHGEHGYGNLDVLSETGERRRILEIGDPIDAPVYSSTGHILFRRGGNAEGVWAFPFSLESLDRTGEPFLVAADADEPSASMDGTLTYLIGDANPLAELVLLDRDGRELRTIGTPVSSSRPFPVFSPDEKSLVISLNFADSRELYAYDLASGNSRRLTFNDMREDIATWMPDGKQILYYESNSYYTYTLSLDGSVENDRLLQGIMAVVTPDGSHVVFARRQPNSWNWDIFTRPFAGGEEEAVELVSTDGVDWLPWISPDGRYLAYTSNESGRDEVYMTTFPKPSTRWQVSSDGGFGPRWAPESGEIFYTTRNRIFAVPVSTKGSLSMGTPRVLFDRPSTDWSAQWPDGFDVTADGQRFVMMRPVEGESEVESAIVIVQNWYREFEDGD